MSPENSIVLGEIVAAHGIRGDVKIRTFTGSPLDLSSYGDLFYADGTTLTLKIRRAKGDHAVIAFVEGTKSRNDAEALIKKKIFIHKNQLPDVGSEDAAYYSQLEGMAIQNSEDEVLGIVTAIYNFGAGDILEFTTSDKKTLSVPYQDFAIHTVDMENKIIVINPDMAV